MHQYGYGSTPFTAGASNPQAIRQQIAQDLGQTQWQGAPAGTTAGLYGTSTFAQFGTNPQLVQQQIQQDLAQARAPQGAYGQVANPAVMTAGASNPQFVRQQIAQDLGQGAWQGPAMAMQAGGIGTSTLAQFGSNPQEIRQQIAQDLGQAAWQGPAMAAPPTAVHGTSTFAQFGTNPQFVQQQIARDLGHVQGPAMMAQPQYLNPYAQAGVYQPVQNQAYYNPAVFQQVMGAVQTNPQQVRQQIQQDIQSGLQPPAFLTHAQGMAAQTAPALPGQAFTASTLGQFGTDPQLVRQQIQSDLGQARYFS
ncbi:MAG: hypothetical protein K6T30_07915 [Alicyclobacillus sp.]|nr:hypothetical protein [Alicyclobacillus sp.]